jgi:hypothetical protein
MATVTLTGTLLGANVGPFNIYHTSETYGNLLASNVSRAVLDSGFQTNQIYDLYIIRSTGICTNAVEVSLSNPTPTPTVSPSPTPTPSNSPGAGVTPTPSPSVSKTPTPTPSVTATPGASATPTPTPSTNLSEVDLRYVTFGGATGACNSLNLDTVWLDSSTFAVATKIYANSAGTAFAPIRTWSDGFVWRNSDVNGNLTFPESCTAPTPTPTTSPRDVIYEVRECGGFTNYYFSINSSGLPNDLAIKVTGDFSTFPNGKCWEIIDALVGSVPVDYYVSLDSVFPGCIACSPSTPTPTPTKSPTPTPSLSGISLTSFQMDSTSYSNPNDACNFGLPNITYYHNGSGAYPIPGDTVYTNSGGTNLLSSGTYYVMGDNSAIIVSSGLVATKTSC